MAPVSMMSSSLPSAWARSHRPSIAAATAAAAAAAAANTNKKDDHHRNPTTGRRSSSSAETDADALTTVRVRELDSYMRSHLHT